MAATSSGHIPSSYEKRWVSQGLSSIGLEVKIEVEAIPTIFQVPKKLKETKSEAYTPQKLGLGPYLHLSPEFHVADRQKHTVVKELIHQLELSDFSQQFMDKMKNLEPVIRSNYDNYLDLEASTLAYIMAIDSLFLLAFLLNTNKEENESNNLNLVCNELAKDVLMLENQIPAAMLTLTGKELGLFRYIAGGSSFKGETKLYAEFFYDFCTAHSPLKLAELRENRRKESKHLLAHLYYLRVNNQGLKDEDDDDDDDKAMPESPPRQSPDSSMVGAVAKISVTINEGVIRLKDQERSLLDERVMKPLLVVTSILKVWKNSSFANYIFKEEEEKAKIEEIQIPSVSALSEKFNVDFKPTRRGIRDIIFQATEEDGEANTLYLPEIKLGYDSEVVLRNLVAYEAAAFATLAGSKLELTDYVDLMCGIVDTTKDVQLLRNKGIIVEGGLSDEKIAEMFNGINRSTGGQSEKKSESQMAVEEVNTMVEKLESKKLWRRAYKFCNKIVKSARELFLKKPAIIALKYLTHIFMAALLVLQILQAYCEVYGCSHRESQTTNVATHLMSII